MISFSKRVKEIPPYLFASIDQIKQDEIKKGRKLISLGIGDPDLPTPTFIIEKLYEAARKPENHHYPSYWGQSLFRKAIANWYLKRFAVTLDHEKEVMALIGSKEGIAHLPLAFINPGDHVLVPDPGYPVYSVATRFAGGRPLFFKLRPENDFLPDFGELKKLVQKNKKTKLIFLNYPNNPTSAIASVGFFKELVSFAQKYGIVVCHDNAYSEIYFAGEKFNGEKPPSFLEVPGAKDIGCEFHSLSKTFNMTGWRVGFIVGNAKILQGLSLIKTNMDSGVFNACQEAGAAALENSEPFCTELRAIYQRRRDILVPALKEIGLKVQIPKATFYLWTKIPTKTKSYDFVLNLIKKHGIIATPGSGFGRAGEGFVRFTICTNEETLKQVAEILKNSV
ncbi:MAG: LL-diaminopimelate aminotransferase [Deltaproteobacteria bacterium]|nr:LL-diaminopimelate aminotransferase [Deltaproteobacteria bacterium]